MIGKVIYKEKVMIGKVINKEIATSFWVGRDNDGQCHVFNEEPCMLGKGDDLVWYAEDGMQPLDVTSSNLFTCIQPGCLYKVTMNIKLKNYDEENLPLLMA